MGLAGAPEVRRERAEAAGGWNAGGMADPLQPSAAAASGEACGILTRARSSSMAQSPPDRGRAQKTPEVLAASASPSKQGWAAG